MNSYPLAARHLHICTVGNRDTVQLKDPPRFSEIVSKHRHASISSDLSSLSAKAGDSRTSKASAAKARSKITFLSGVIRRWIPIQNFLTITAILDEQQNIVASSTPTILSSLAAYWTPFLDGTSSGVDETVAQSVLREMDASAWNWSSYRLPGHRDFCNTVCLSVDSAPGLDGLPFSA
eukprot:12294806-Karenia_brevis.AAC.1